MAAGTSPSSGVPLIHRSAFLRTLAAPLLLWTTLVVAALLARQPGVVCITPMAWLLALWSGGQYVRISGGQLGRQPLIGPALTGALLGLGQGVLFGLVTSLGMPPSTPEDTMKTWVLTLIIVIVGVVVCMALSMLTAALTLRRYSRM